MSGLKRPYSNDEGEGDNFDDISTATVRRKLEWATDSVDITCASPWETARPGSASGSWKGCETEEASVPAHEFGAGYRTYRFGNPELLPPAAAGSAWGVTLMNTRSGN